jgi:sugar phosphate permease
MTVPGHILTRRVHPAWIVAATGFAVLLLGAGFRATPGVLMVPLQDEFGWSRAVISGAVSLNLILYGLAGPFAAALTARFGLRRVVPVALALIAAGSALTVVMTQPWQLYVCWGLLVGAGTGTIAPVLAATISNRWFAQRRGLVLGLLTAGSSTGQLLFLPVLSMLTMDSGWRAASWTVAIAALAIAPVAVWLLRERPADIGARRFGATEDDVPPAPASRPVATAFRVLREASSTRVFWVLAGSFFICGLTTNGLIATHFIPAAMDHNMPETQAASMLAAMGVLDVAGTTASGWLTDRFDARRLLFTYYGLRGLSLLFLPHALAAQHLGLGAFVIFYGLDWIATVPPTVSLATSAFGTERGTIVWGWVFASHQIGAAVAAASAGWIRDTAGTYDPAFFAAGFLALLAAGLVLLVRSSRVAVAEPVRAMS